MFTCNEKHCTLIQWSELNMIPIPKSGDLREGENYRGISLSCVITKVAPSRLGPSAVLIARCQHPHCPHIKVIVTIVLDY